MELRDTVINIHLPALLELEEFCVMLKQEVDLLFGLFETLAFAANIELKKGAIKCTGCSLRFVTDICRSMCVVCGSGGKSGNPLLPVRCWFEAER